MGYIVGYSKSKAGYRVTLGDTMVTSAHVLFDERLSQRLLLKTTRIL